MVSTLGRGILPISNKSVFCLKGKRNPRPSAAGTAAALLRPPPGLTPGHARVSRTFRGTTAQSKLQRSRPSRTSGKEPRGVAVASSGSRCPTLALPRLPASPRGTPGRRATPTRLAASEGREHRGATAHLGPGRCAQAREASTRVRVPSSGHHA